VIADFGDGIQVLNGRYGPYITNGEKNAKIPKERDPKSLTHEECNALIEAAPVRRGRGAFKKAAAKKAAPKKAPVKKSAARKAAPKKTASGMAGKKTAANKTAGRRTPRKTAAKKTARAKPSASIGAETPPFDT
jgi:DNA topoisomerase-1